jgi:hypothetical protein
LIYDCNTQSLHHPATPPPFLSTGENRSSPRQGPMAVYSLLHTTPSTRHLAQCMSRHCCGGRAPGWAATSEGPCASRLKAMQPCIHDMLRNIHIHPAAPHAIILLAVQRKFTNIYVHCWATTARRPPPPPSWMHSIQTGRRQGTSCCQLWSPPLQIQRPGPHQSTSNTAPRHPKKAYQWSCGLLTCGREERYMLQTK